MNKIIIKSQNGDINLNDILIKGGDSIENLKGCLMLNISCKDWHSFLEFFIDENDLHEEGLEQDCHVTILYGLLDEYLSVDELREFVTGFVQHHPIDFSLSEISIFENEEFDVVKFGVQSNALSILNDHVRKIFEYESKFQDYQPHMTIAYVKKGTGKKYAGISPNLDFSFSNIVYSNPDKNHEIIYDFKTEVVLNGDKVIVRKK